MLKDHFLVFLFSVIHISLFLKGTSLFCAITQNRGLRERHLKMKTKLQSNFSEQVRINSAQRTWQLAHPGALPEKLRHKTICQVIQQGRSLPDSFKRKQNEDSNYSHRTLQ